MLAPDWSTIIMRLSQTLRISNAQLAERLGVNTTTLSGWKNAGCEPRYSSGHKLVCLYKKTVSEDIPTF